MLRTLVPVALALACATATSAQAPAAPREEAVQLRVPAGTLAGTLLVPAAPRPVPAVLLIAGSGPTDRDGNSAALPGPNNSLRMLAEGLAARGIASLRFDKRGVAGSAGALTREEEIRFDTMIADAEGWVRMLRADPRFSTVTVVGHSEGSLIGMVAARQAGAHGFVSVAGIARRASDVLRGQLRPRLPAELVARSDSVLAELEAGRLVDRTPPELAMLYRASVQPYLVSWFRRDPAAEIAQLRIPVLVAQGTTDIQVGVGEARALHAALPASRLLVVDGMNHVLKLVPADPAAQQASYSDPALPVAPQLVEAVAEFVKGVRR
jgi:hypothetical protein